MTIAYRLFDVLNVNRQQGANVPWVEQCACPQGHTGLSCEVSPSLTSFCSRSHQQVLSSFLQICAPGYSMEGGTCRPRQEECPRGMYRWSTSWWSGKVKIARGKIGERGRECQTLFVVFSAILISPSPSSSLSSSPSLSFSSSSSSQRTWRRMWNVPLPTYQSKQPVCNQLFPRPGWPGDKKMTGRFFGSFGKVFKGQRTPEVPSRGRYQKSKCMLYHRFSATFSCGNSIVSGVNFWCSCSMKVIDVSFKNFPNSVTKSPSNCDNFPWKCFEHSNRGTWYWLQGVTFKNFLLPNTPMWQSPRIGEVCGFYPGGYPQNPQLYFKPEIADRRGGPLDSAIFWLRK